MILEAVISGLWASGNDRFSVRGQEIAMFEVWNAVPGAGGWEEGRGYEGGQGKGQARAVQLFMAKGDRRGGKGNNF